MLRGLILGIVGFAAAFSASKQFETVGKDIARYDKIRAMSGDPPFLREQGGKLLALARARALQRPDAGRGLISAFLDDVMRYARIRSM